MAELWFKQKSRGWGWSPASWQGWVATVVYGVALGLGIAWFLVEARNERPVAGFLALLAITGAFFALCWTKGERPRWRRGK